MKSDGESTEAPKASKQAPSDKGFEHIVKSGDTLSGIITAYREQNIKVNKEQIMAANPGLVPEKMRLGQKIWIPAPQQCPEALSRSFSICYSLFYTSWGKGNTMTKVAILPERSAKGVMMYRAVAGAHKQLPIQPVRLWMH